MRRKAPQEVDLKKIVAAVRCAERVFLIGNGGSYANAMHIAGDLQMVGINAAVLDPANLTRIANDFSYNKVFSNWLELVATHKDLLIALSGSGNSLNIREAVMTARRKKVPIVGVTMDARSVLARYATYPVVRGANMQRTEENQIMFGHTLMKALRG